MMNVVKCVASATKFYSKMFIQPEKFKLMVSQFPFSVQTHKLITRGYCTLNPSRLVFEAYNKRNEEKLKSLLEQPKYLALYDKYKLEIEFLRITSGRVPQMLRAYDWLHLMQTASKGQRRSYLEFRWKIEKKEENRMKKQELKREMGEMKKIDDDDDNPYGLKKCTLFHRIRDQQMNNFYNSRLISAMLYEPTVVFDLDYDQYMGPSEQLNCAKQLLLSFSVNRVHDNPLNLYFCNVNKSSLTMQKLHQIMPNIYDTDFPLNITSKSYLEVFDKDKLVYLTPHTQNVMKTYDPNLIYIIGGMVDKVDPKPMSFQKANRENIKMMKFPLSEKLEWGMGSKKNLPLNHVLSILLELRMTNDWNTVLDCTIPKRKLRQSREENMKKLIRKRQILLNNLQSRH